MRVRSRPLLATSLLLLAAAWGIGMQAGPQVATDGSDLVVHGEGDEVVLETQLQPLGEQQWARLVASGVPIGNHSVLAFQEAGVWVVATADVPLPLGVPTRIDGVVAAEPQGDPILVVVQVLEHHTDLLG